MLEAALQRFENIQGFTLAGCSHRGRARPIASGVGRIQQRCGQLAGAGRGELNVVALRIEQHAAFGAAVTVLRAGNSTDDVGGIVPRLSAIGQERAEIRPYLVTAMSQLGGNTQVSGDMA